MGMYNSLRAALSTHSIIFFNSLAGHRKSAHGPDAARRLGTPDLRCKQMTQSDHKRIP
jgi:hypothetical protein